MNEINILDRGERLQIEQDGKVTFTIHYDKHTGDWGVMPQEGMHGVDYFLDKQSALDAALSMAGVLVDPDVNRAPDRC